ncbi:MAG TPA: 16S rRNA (guanine(527)-N(7))-methyltransferase RsmG [Allosphingosinicella sp.]|jgi:16S rRNA (guanine527-N7)-methyltransferase|nr:16S rRNA (guanine(527)-N(7))-methyltransferase RsmG [Allosphingosinicella sp.]
MDEAEARERLAVPRETLQRLDCFVDLLRQENERQNLVSRASLDHVWERHILDSAQLLRYTPPGAATWIDLGTGAGFPGLVIAAMTSVRLTLVEGRKLRADFLRRAAELMGLTDIEILCAKAEAIPVRPFDVISARAFAPLDHLLTIGRRFSTDKTTWILPKGRNAKTELEAADSSWQGDLRLEPSLTDPDAQIVVATGVRPRKRGKGAR